MTTPPTTLLIACGALAREVTSLIETHSWTHMTVQCLPAILHNSPADIPGNVRQKILANKDSFEKIMVVYGDCGTGGQLDTVLAEEGIERIPGPHCYEFYAGIDEFRTLSEDNPGTFYLTDYLIRQFEKLVIEGLGLDRHPQLLQTYFGNYSRLVYLAQVANPELQNKAKAAADRLGLSYEYRLTGLGGLADFLTTGNMTIGNKEH